MSENKKRRAFVSGRLTDVNVALPVAVLADEDVTLVVQVVDDHIPVALEIMQDYSFDLHFKYKLLIKEHADLNTRIIRLL